jgi:hypothetical protein
MRKMKMCCWCGGVIEPTIHDCCDPKSEKQYRYWNRGSKIKKSRGDYSKRKSFITNKFSFFG